MAIDDAQVPPPPDLPGDPGESYRPSPEDVAPKSPIPRSSDPDSETAVLPSSDAVEAPEEAPEPVTRSFVLEERIGAGGFGEVWRAVQVGLHRHVAVKRPFAGRNLTERGSSAGRDEAFFRQEALTNAALEHPNIVPVHELGTDDQGLPLLAMKLLRGKRWDALLLHDIQALDQTEYLARHLPILVAVAQAVAFAHSKGIVHRDLKPSQVMVGEFGEVQLLDWGLALIYDAVLARRELPLLADSHCGPPPRDKARSPAGTVAFMAPEQTRSTACGVGPWTDIFQLGGILYYIITGHAPITGSNASLCYYNAAEGRIEHPARVPGPWPPPPELAALAMRTLAAHKEDRPSAATEFIEAIRAYLSGSSRRRESLALTDPLDALEAPEELGYERLAGLLNDVSRARALWPGNEAAVRWRERLLEAQARHALGLGDLALARATSQLLEEEGRRTPLLREVGTAEETAARQRRQRRVLAASTAVLILGATSITAFLNVRLTQERDAAVAARTSEQAARRAEADARRRSEESRRRAERLLGQLLGDYKRELERRGQLNLMAPMLGLVRDYFAALPEGDWRIEDRMLHADFLERLASNTSDLDRIAEALPVAALAAQARRTIAADPAAQTSRTLVLRQLGGAEVLRARLLLRAGDTPAATAAVAEARLAASGALESTPGDCGAERVLAVVRKLEGQLAELRGALPEALLCHEEAVAAFERGAAAGGCIGTDLADNQHDEALVLLSDARRRSGDTVGAEEAMGRALSRARGRAAADAGDQLAANALANVLGLAGELALAAGDAPRAGRLLDEGVAILDAGVQRDPGNVPSQARLATMLGRQAGALRRAGRLAEAAAAIRRTISIRDGLLAHDPGNLSVKRSQAWSYDTASDIERDRGAVAEAIGLQDRALAIRREVVAATPGDLPRQAELATSHAELGSLHRRARDPRASLAAYREHERLIDELLARDRTNVPWLASKAVNAVGMGQSALLAGEPGEARRAAERAVEAGRATLGRDASDPFGRRAIIGGEMLLGDLAAAEGDTEEARRHWSAAYEVAAPTARPDASVGERASAAALLLRFGRADEARALLPEGFGAESAWDPADAGTLELARRAGLATPKTASSPAADGAGDSKGTPP